MKKKEIKEITNYPIYYVDMEPLMKKKDISKTSLSKMTNISFYGLQRYCKSEIKRVDLDIISRICAALDCRIEDILKR